jgi:hypothetical protein
MTSLFHRSPFVVAGAAVLLAVPASFASAQPPAAPPAPITQVLTLLTVKPGIDRAQIVKVMPDEVRDTVKMHLAGKIQQWYGNADGRGVVFILNATSIDEAKALMNSLPLGRNQLADFQFIGLTPLTPLRIIVDPPPAPAGAPKQ